MTVASAPSLQGTCATKDNQTRSLRILLYNVLLICSRMEVEHIKQRFDVQLCKNPRCIQDKIWCLRVVWRCLERISRYVVLGP